MNTDLLKNGDLAEAINHGNLNYYRLLICEIDELKESSGDTGKLIALEAALGLAIYEQYKLHVESIEEEQQEENHLARLWGGKPECKGGIAA